MQLQQFEARMMAQQHALARRLEEGLSKLDARVAALEGHQRQAQAQAQAAGTATATAAEQQLDHVLDSAMDDVE